MASNTTAKRLFGLNALVAWIGFGGQFLINLFDIIPYTQPDPTLLGHSAAGWPGAIGRIFDSMTYFTNWSNLVVCISLTALFLAPARAGGVFTTLRNSGLFMITMTGILYHLLIAPYANPESWNALTSLFEHYITPVTTVAVWVIVGPRGRFTMRETLRIYALPLTWIAFALVRGAVQGVYPYGFLNVATLGYPAVLTLVVEILIAGYVIALLFAAIDRLLSRGRGASVGARA